MRSRHAIAAVAGLAALFALSSAGAGTFTISPLRVDFTGATGTAALTVRNEEAAPVVVQAEGLAWSQDEGQDALSPTRDLLVRIALRRGPDATRELAYRMVLQEVPQAASPDFNGLQVALRLSIPVFVAPLAPSAPELEWTGRTGADGRTTLVVRNEGAANARIHHFALKAADGRTLFEQPGLAYVLPGASRQWIIDNKNEPAQANAVVAIGPGTYRLEGNTDRGAFAAGLKVAAD